jgi:hypothetical protein
MITTLLFPVDQPNLFVKQVCPGCNLPYVAYDSVKHIYLCQQCVKHDLLWEYVLLVMQEMHNLEAVVHGQLAIEQTIRAQYTEMLNMTTDLLEGVKRRHLKT